MLFQIVTACAVALSFLPSTVQTGSQSQVALVDPGFESFKMARDPKLGWYSDDIVIKDDPRWADKFAVIRMTPDAEYKVEGNYSLRISQGRPRRNFGRAFLCQSVPLQKSGGMRNFDLGLQMRGGLRGTVLIDIYVWDGEMARAIASRNVKVGKDWSPANVSFKVPSGYDRFGIWIYMPNEEEALLWLDDLRLVPAGK